VDPIQILGVVAAATSTVLFLPQAAQAWRVRRDAHALRGLSVGTYVLVLANAVLWGVYAVLTGALWSGAPGLLNGPLAIAMIWLILNARIRKTRTLRCACGTASGIDHSWVVTAPPGAGTRFTPCPNDPDVCNQRWGHPELAGP